MSKCIKTVLVLALLSPLCGTRPPAAWGAEARRLTQADIDEMGGPNFQGGDGDYLLRNDRLDAVILAVGVTPDGVGSVFSNGIAPTGGLLIDAMTRSDGANDRNDQLQVVAHNVNLSTVAGGAIYYRCQQPEPEPAKPVCSVSGVSEDGETASITVTGAVVFPGFGPRAGSVSSVERPTITATTTYELADGNSFIDVTTRITNTGQEPLPIFTVGDENRYVRNQLVFQPFPDRGPYAPPGSLLSPNPSIGVYPWYPMLGLHDLRTYLERKKVDTGGLSDADRVAPICYAFVARSLEEPAKEPPFEELERPSLVGWDSGRRNIASRMFDVDRYSRPENLEGGAEMTYRRRFVVAPGGTVEDCARVARPLLWGADARTFRGRVVTAEGTPIANASVFFDNENPGFPDDPEGKLNDLSTWIDDDQDGTGDRELRAKAGSPVPFTHTRTGEDGIFTVKLPWLRPTGGEATVYQARVIAENRPIVTLDDCCKVTPTNIQKERQLGEVVVARTGRVNVTVREHVGDSFRATPAQIAIFGRRGTENPDLGEQFQTRRHFMGLSQTERPFPLVSRKEQRYVLEPGFWSDWVADKAFSYSLQTAADVDYTVVVELGDYYQDKSTGFKVMSDYAQPSGQAGPRWELRVPRSAQGSVRKLFSASSATETAVMFTVRVSEFGEEEPEILSRRNTRQMSETARGYPAVNVDASHDGVFSLELPPGHYSVWASRGPEYTFDTVRFSLEAGQILTLDSEHSGDLAGLTLRRVLETPGWVSVDGHVHAAPSSDAGVPLTDRVVSMLAAGVRTIISTDHDQLADYRPQIEALGMEDEITSVIGAEFSGESAVPRSAATLNCNAYPLTIGHIIGWPLSIVEGNRRRGAPTDEQLLPATVFDRIRGMDSLRELKRDDGVVPTPDTATRAEWLAAILGRDGNRELPPDEEVIVYAHPRGTLTLGPFRNFGPPRLGGYNPNLPVDAYPNLLANLESAYEMPDGTATRGLDFDAFEMLSSTLIDWYLLTRGDWFSLLSQGLHKAAVAGSDTHRPIIDGAGYPRFYVKCDAPCTEEKLVEGVRGLEVMGTTGPFIKFDVVGDDEQESDTLVSGIGRTVTATKAKQPKLKLRVEVLAADWIPVEEIRIFQNGRLVNPKTWKICPPGTAAGDDACGPLPRLEPLDGPLQRFGGTIELAEGLDSDAYFVVEAGSKINPLDKGAFPKGVAVHPIQLNTMRRLTTSDMVSLAFTNPIFIDRDGGGYQPPGLPPQQPPPQFAGQCQPPARQAGRPAAPAAAPGGAVGPFRTTDGRPAELGMTEAELRARVETAGVKTLKKGRRSLTQLGPPDTQSPRLEIFHRDIGSEQFAYAEYELFDGKVFRVRWRLAPGFERPVYPALRDELSSLLSASPDLDELLGADPHDREGSTPTLRSAIWVPTTAAFEDLLSGAEEAEADPEEPPFADQALIVLLELRQIEPLTGGPVFLAVGDLAKIESIIEERLPILEEPDDREAWWEPGAQAPLGIPSKADLDKLTQDFTVAVDPVLDALNLADPSLVE